MVVAVFSVIVALLLGRAGYDEMVVLGIRGGLVQPFWAGVTGVVVALLVGLAGIWFWRRWRGAHALALTAAATSIVFHVYGALPPHRNVGIIGAVLGVGSGLVLLVGTRQRGKRAAPVSAGRAV
jgi:protein-S-isoprenylcysteine O-methyltransferase Ste14